MALASVFGLLYVLVAAATAALVVWALVLVIIFLRLRIAQLCGDTGSPQ